MIRFEKAHPSHLDIGRFGEDQAEKYLKKLGYRIVTRNFRAGKNELDIIAIDGGCIVFVEVKTRSGVGTYEYDYGTPASAVTKEKRHHTVAAAKNYLRAHPTDKEPRFDIIEVYLEKVTSLSPLRVQKLEHIPNAYLK